MSVISWFRESTRKEEGVELLSVRQAAALLGVDDSRVRQLLHVGALAGQRVGGRWLVDGASVRDRRERGVRATRPLSARNAWGLLAILAGRTPAGLSPAEKSRLKARIRNLAAHEPLPAAQFRDLLAARAQQRRYRVHSGLLRAVAADPEVVAAGASAAAAIGADYVALGRAEIYAHPRAVARLEAAFGLVSDEPSNLLVRVPPAAVWPFLKPATEPSPPAAVVAADLLDIHEDRADTAAIALLRPLLDHHLNNSARSA